MNVAKDAMSSYQMAIDVTGGNVANVNTPGYSRQRAVLNAVGTLMVKGETAQIGVEVSNVERIYDDFLESQMVDQAKLVGYNTARKETLDRVETIFNETGDGGLSDLLAQFWGAWNTVSGNPGGQVERNALLAASENLASAFNSKSNELVEIQRDADKSISETIALVNTTITEIASLNQQISSLGMPNTGDANPLQDKRMVLLKDLGNLIDINYFESGEGSYNIFLANGRSLVIGGNAWELAVMADPAAADYYNYHVIYEGSTDPGENLNDVLSDGHNGKLGGLIDARDGISDYLDTLDELASSIITEVNEQHRMGFDAYKNAGGDFFVPAGVDDIARNMALTVEIAGDTSKIAAAQTVSGDGDNARLIGSMKDALLMNGGKATLGDYYATLVGTVGRDSAGAARMAEYQSVIMDNLAGKREGISGVSIDEEMMNLIKYQLGYNAAARLCTTANEMLDVLVNLGK